MHVARRSLALTTRALLSSAGRSLGAGAGAALRQRRRQEQKRADQLQDPARSVGGGGPQPPPFFNLLLFLHPQGTRGTFSRLTRTPET